ncbi:MAG TPA: insulinase family protein [Hyphomonadaceae bacterium]|nr:insulinase family protein [Hyphomonadaceae bacterium]
MKRLIAWLFAGALLAAPALAQAPKAPPKPPAQVTKPVAAKPAAKPKPLWAHLASDIAPDPAVKYGVLPNGMRYALMKNQLPAGAISIRLSMHVGSLNEADNEKGLAHFIEHMAFNGSKKVPEGDMVKILERLGLAFGADTNASTDQEFTTYMLELPNASDNLVDESLFLMREVASELTFNADAIDRERGVVLSELRRGDNFQKRRSDQELEFLIPGAYAITRMPIGEAQILETAPRERLVSLYERFYRPERATMVIVGDFDVATMEGKIKAKFADWKGVGTNPKEPDLSYALKKDRPSAASVFVHKDGGNSIGVYAETPFTDPPDTAANRKEANLLNFATGAVGRRLAPMANSEDPPFRSAGIAGSDILEAVDVASGSVSVTPESWKPGLQALEQEWRRALLYGFTKDEVDLQLSAMRTSQQNAAQRENTRTTGQLVSQLLGSIQDDAVFSTPSSGLKRFEGWEKSVTPAQVQAVFKKWMQMKNPLFFMSSTVDRPGVEAEIVKAWEESAKTAVKPPEAKSALTFAYTDFGTPGKVSSDTRIADIDTRMIVFENNVRLNLKKTTFSKNAVQVSVRVGNGDLDLPQTPYGFSSIASALSGGGLEKHSADDLRTILAGKQVQTRFAPSGTSFGGTYATTPTDLLLQLQVSAAFLTHPGYRPEAERRWRQSVELAWPRLDANAGTVWSAKGMRMLASGDTRFGSDKDDGETKRTFAELKPILAPRLASGAIEIAIVGDMDEQAAIDAVAKTFGALPKRESIQTKFKDPNPPKFRTDKSPIVLTHAGEQNQALAFVYWPVSIDPDVDPQAARVVGAMVTVMRLKVTEEIREALGATYSPTANSSLSSYYSGFGYMNAGAEVKPEDADKVIKALEKIAAQMRAGDISDDEFSRAITPQLEVLPQNATSNGYWVSILAQAQSRPDYTERNKLPAIKAAVEKITKADIITAANKWLLESTQQEAKVVPGPKGP